MYIPAGRYRNQINTRLVGQFYVQMSGSIVVLSGGTATNELVSVFNELSSRVIYVLPILDNGGSTSEIIRVIGGPAIGDIRSRLTRLIPDLKAQLRNLLSFRLDSDPNEARIQWNEIVEGIHPLWNGISLSTKEIIRSFMVHVHVELLKRSKITSNSTNNKQFRYELANVGNLFLTGIRLFIGSLDSAIELFMKLTDIDSSTEVLPCINTNFSYHIGAILSNGLIITGQSQISHPSTDREIYPPPIHHTRPSTPTRELQFRLNIGTFDQESPAMSSDEELGNIPQYTHPELKKSQLHFNKTDNIEPLLAPIERVFYISPYGEEICPTAQSKVSSTMTKAETIVYSIGSLMTSLLPIIILKGIGKAIVHSQAKARNKILLLNGCEDRETFGMKATDYVRIIVELANYSLVKSNLKPVEHWNRIITHLFYIEEPNIPVDISFLKEKNITCIGIKRDQLHCDRYDMKDLQKALGELSEIAH